MTGRRLEYDNITVEYFRSLPEMHATLKTREVVYERDAFLTEGYEDYCHPKKSFNGFSSVEELRRQVVGGSKDIKEVKNVRAFAHSLKCNDLKGRGKKPSCITGQFRMGRYLDGDPMCFDRTVRIMKPNKLIKLVVNMSADGSVPPEDIEDACKIVARNVVALEKEGYRVRLTVCKCNHFWDNDTYHTAVVDLKDEGHCVNYRKLCFGLSVMMYRGAFFSWLACEPECPSGLGTAESDEDLVGPMLVKVLNPKGVWYTHLYDLMDLVRKNRHDLYKASDALHAQIIESME